jgi:hypothetical protein
MGLYDVADVPVLSKPTKPSSAADEHHHLARGPSSLWPPPPLSGLYLPLLSHMTLRGQLTPQLDINAVPRRTRLHLLLRTFCRRQQRRRLPESMSPEPCATSCATITTRPRRSVREVRQEFNGVRVAAALRQAALVPPVQGLAVHGLHRAGGAEGAAWVWAQKRV